MARESASQPVRRDPPLVMVVDDDPTILDLLRAVLLEEGYRVNAALNGAQALGFPADQAPAVVVLDMFLPGMNGPELAVALRSKFGAQLPILVTSASNVDAEAQALGAYEYLPKPFDLDALLAGVRRGLNLGSG